MKNTVIIKEHIAINDIINIDLVTASDKQEKLFDSIWRNVMSITELLNDDTYHAEWKASLAENHNESYVKEIF